MTDRAVHRARHCAHAHVHRDHAWFALITVARALVGLADHAALAMRAAIASVRALDAV